MSTMHGNNCAQKLVKSSIQRHTLNIAMTVSVTARRETGNPDYASTAGLVNHEEQSHGRLQVLIQTLHFIFHLCLKRC